MEKERGGWKVENVRKQVAGNCANTKFNKLVNVAGKKEISNVKEKEIILTYLEVGTTGSFPGWGFGQFNSAVREASAGIYYSDRRRVWNPRMNV
ncbi:hypothetical protein Zmor_007542 [Zophobas morio]|uniref:Uncharacterized protein n=1 Tax=Zophobas morio TaxID=2755281 RepID=A0AA38IS38_9CUCU|nr:hypothetical protein Zmor_007542 [Zophobas morio]